MSDLFELLRDRGFVQDATPGAAEHGDEIRGAYRSGYAQISLRKQLSNLVMLGVDLAMMSGAGAAIFHPRSGVASA